MKQFRNKHEPKVTQEPHDNIAMNGNIFELINQIQNFKGDPNQILQQMISSGRYSQEQIEAAKKKATQMESALNMLGFKGR